MSRLAILAIMSLSFTSFVFAQIRNDQCQLSIRVRTPQDSQLNSPLQVELLSNGGTPIMEVQTDSNGNADFEAMSGNRYKVRVSGQGVETTIVEFRIPDGEQIYMEMVNVKLTAPDGSESKTPTNSPTVSVTEMNIPGRAREEFQKGMQEYTKGDMGKAEQRFQKAISIYPQYARAYEGVGFIAIKTNDRAKAEQAFSKAIEADDKFAPGYVDLARIDFQKKNYVQAEALLRKATALNPAYLDALALLASTQYMNKEYDSALVNARRTHALPDHERFADIHLLAGKILEMQGRPHEAITEYQFFLKESPNNSQVAVVQREVAQLEAENR